MFIHSFMLVHVHLCMYTHALSIGWAFVSSLQAMKPAVHHPICWMESYPSNHPHVPCEWGLHQPLLPMMLCTLPNLARETNVYSTHVFRAWTIQHIHPTSKRLPVYWCILIGTDQLPIENPQEEEVNSSLPLLFSGNWYSAIMTIMNLSKALLNPCPWMHLISIHVGAHHHILSPLLCTLARSPASHLSCVFYHSVSLDEPHGVLVFSCVTLATESCLEMDKWDPESFGNQEFARCGNYHNILCFCSKKGVRVGNWRQV